MRSGRTIAGSMSLVGAPLAVTVGKACPMMGFRGPPDPSRRAAFAPAGVPEPAPKVILPGAYQLRPTASFDASGPQVAAGTPTRVVRVTDQARWAANGRPVILAEVEVWSDPPASRRRGFVPLAMSDFRPAPDTTADLLNDLLVAYGRAAAALGPPPDMVGAPRPAAATAAPSSPLVPVWTPPAAPTGGASVPSPGSAWAPPASSALVSPARVAPMSVTMSLAQPLSVPTPPSSASGVGIVVAGLGIAGGIAAAVALVLRLRRGR